MGCLGYLGFCYEECGKTGETKMATIVRLLKGKTGKLCGLDYDNMTFLKNCTFHVKAIIIIYSVTFVRGIRGRSLDDIGVGIRVLVRSRILTTVYRPDRLWGPPNHLSNAYGGAPFHGGKAAGA
jgi:hypothetical protein